jgi:two-component system sensor histidine kinase PilS (NtrC family)
VRAADRVKFSGMSSAEVPTSLQTVAAAEPRPETGYADLAWRVLILLNVFRVLLGLLLLSIFFLITGPHLVGENDPELALLSLAALLASGCIWLLLAQQRSFGQLQTYAAFAIDLITLTALMHASGGIASGFGGLLIVSVGGAALLVPRDRAFLLAALTTLALLFEQTLASWAGMSTPEQFAPAGVLGAVIFIITGVVLLLRRRVVETEALAAQRGVDLRNLVELNDYIIQHLRESIVVVDAGDRVRLLNESASNQLGIDRSSAGTPLAEASPVLAERLTAWRQTGGAAAPFASADGSADIQPHFASLGAGRADGLVIFLEDTSLIAERVQQMKLAALGRLSASIAHEIRNPLGALSHAGQLLAESPQIGSDERRLTDIIRVNSNRVSQIVESVLALSKGDTMRPERLELRAWASAFANEFVQTQELYEDAVAVSRDAAEVDIQMDPTHLHQVLWNLCDNAVKYASLTAGAISVELRCGQQEASGRPYLEIADRGPGVEPGKVEQIFEPFYTDQPGGTGLGLYICRELCERNGATLRYSPRPGGGSVFRIIFADPHRWQMSEKTA